MNAPRVSIDRQQVRTRVLARPVVVAMGDSITTGVGDVAQEASARGWAAHVAWALGAKHFVNLARNGTRAREVLSSQVTAARSHAPDLVLLTVGGNDVLRGDFSAREVEIHMDRVMQQISAPGTVVVLTTLPRIGLFDVAPVAVSSVMAQRIQAVNLAITAVARRHRAVMIDGAHILQSTGHRGWHIDRVHPSATGHRQLAHAAIGALGEYWPQRRALAPAPRPPGRAYRMWWLFSRGTPWLLRRSVDLIPQVLMMVASEVRAQRASEAIGTEDDATLASLHDDGVWVR